MKIHMTVTVPDGVHANDVKEHAKVAFESWGGEGHPTDPFFPSDQLKVLDAKVVVDTTRWFGRHPSQKET